MKRRLDLLFLLPFALMLAYWQLQYDGYVKDDTFISMRYARNLVEGHGLVFNYGDRLEGYTNFLWVILLTPAQAFGWDMLQWAKLMACVFGQLGLLVTYSLARFFWDDEHDPLSYVAPALWAVSTSVVLWSMAGLEPTLMACLVGGGTLFGMRLLYRSSDEDQSSKRDAVFSALLLALGCLGRPDAHAVFLIALAFAAVDALRRKALPKPWLLWGGVFAAIVGPYHLWRILYFGDLFPNTFYVKAAAGPEVYSAGIGFVKDLLQFNVNPAVFGLALLALLGAKKRLAKLWALTLCLFFLAYMVKIGRDEMKYFRLYLPVYPLALALAADGLRQLVTGLQWLGEKVAPPKPLRATLLVLVALLVAAGMSYCWHFNESKQRWNDQFVHWSEKSFQKMGSYIAQRSEPGDVVLFQDMGAAPFRAPDQKWIDTIGILNRTVAHSLAEIGLNPFMRGAKKRQPGGAAEIRALDAFLLDYFFEEDPKWIAYVAYVPKSQRRRFSKKVRRSGEDDEEQLFAPYLRNNAHAHGLYRDARFQRDFRYTRYWKRNQGYWIVLYERR